MSHKRIVFAFLSIAGFTLAGCNISPWGGGENSISQAPLDDYATKPWIYGTERLIYGIYPQTVVDSYNPIITNLENDSVLDNQNHYYKYQDNYYVWLNANPYSSDCTFDNGSTIVAGQKYWFKCEQIHWIILSNKKHEYYVLSEKLLDAQKYSSIYSIVQDEYYDNNYMTSDIRNWLNYDFYNMAFALGNSAIQTTTVDNSAATTDDKNNIYACENTKDKVFLPSYQDYSNSKYGFSSNSTRRCITTDWARARGASSSTNSETRYNGAYWTRSPYSFESRYAMCINYPGSLMHYEVNWTTCCARPALTLYI